MRRWRLISQLGLLGALALLVFPGASSALLGTYTVSLTPSGPSPTALSVPVGAGYVAFQNTDTVAHTIAFANGWCAKELAPGDRVNCGALGKIGAYPYTVDGASQAQIVVKAIPRSVSLRARRAAIHRGSHLTLHGQLHDIRYGSPPNAGSPQPIIVIARPYAGHPFHRVAVIMARVHQRPGGAQFGKLLWQVRIHPRSSMTYVAIASYQPAGGQVWERAKSKPFRVTVRR